MPARRAMLSSPAHSSTILPSTTRYRSGASQRTRRPVAQTPRRLPVWIASPPIACCLNHTDARRRLRLRASVVDRGFRPIFLLEPGVEVHQARVLPAQRSDIGRVADLVEKVDRSGDLRVLLAKD